MLLKLIILFYMCRHEEEKEYISFKTYDYIDKYCDKYNVDKSEIMLEYGNDVSSEVTNICDHFRTTDKITKSNKCVIRYKLYIVYYNVCVYVCYIGLIPQLYKRYMIVQIDCLLEGALIYHRCDTSIHLHIS